MSVGDSIRKNRERRGMSQGELARKLNVTRSSVSQWESGASRPKMGHVQKIAGIFGIPVSSLINDELHYAVVGIEPTEEELLLAAFRSMDPEKRAIALATVQAMAGVR